MSSEQLGRSETPDAGGPAQARGSRAEGPRLRLVSRALKETELHVVSFTGEEALSSLYRFDVLFATRAPSLPVDAMLAAKATLFVDGESQTTSWSGYPASVILRSRKGEWTFWEMVLRPSLWFYTLIPQNNIFVGRNVREILSQCLDRGNSYGLEYEFHLSRDYAPQDFSMQHNESLYDYMAWKMERDGIYYHFSEDESGERLHLTDTRHSHTGAAADGSTPTLLFSPPSGLEAPHLQEAVQSFTMNARPLPKRVILSDYNWHNPTRTVAGVAVVSDAGTGDVHLYGEGFSTSAEGNRLAELRAQALRCRARNFTGTSTSPVLKSGFNFALRGHFAPELDGEYTVVSVRHEGNQEAWLARVVGIPSDTSAEPIYRNEFTCIPSDVQFRPERRAKRKKIAGMLSAFVDASTDTGFAEVNAQGCYKVVFPQDLSGRGRGRASCWLRRMQPQMGLGYGTTFPLAPGVEVLVAFMDGDPDRPVIAGAVGNAESGYSESPASAQNTGLRTAGGNGLVFNDAGTKQGAVLNTGGRSGIMMTSGSLDTFLEYSDATAHMAASLGNTFAGLAHTVGSGFETSLSASQDEWGAWEGVNTVITTLHKLTASFAVGQTQAARSLTSDAITHGEETPDLTQANRLGTLLSAASGGLKSLQQLLIFIRKLRAGRKGGPSSNKYAAALTAGEETTALNLRTHMSSHAIAKYVAFTTAYITANLVASSVPFAEAYFEQHRLNENKKKLQDLQDERKGMEGDSSDRNGSDGSGGAGGGGSTDTSTDTTGENGSENALPRASAYGASVGGEEADGDGGEDTRTPLQKARDKSELEKEIAAEERLVGIETNLTQMARHSLIRSLTQSVTETLIPEVLSMILFCYKARKGAKPEGILLSSPESTLVSSSKKETVLASQDRVALLAFPDAHNLIKANEPEDVATAVGLDKGSISLLSPDRFVLSFKDAYEASLSSTTATAPKILLSTRKDPLVSSFVTDFNASMTAANAAAAAAAAVAGNAAGAASAATSAAGFTTELAQYEALSGEAGAEIEMDNSVTGKSTLSVTNTRGGLLVSNEPRDTTDTLTIVNKGYSSGLTDECSLTFGHNAVSLGVRDASTSGLRLTDTKKLTLAADSATRIELDAQGKKAEHRADTTTFSATKEFSVDCGKLVAKSTGTMEFSAQSATISSNSTITIKAQGTGKFTASGMIQLG